MNTRHTPGPWMVVNGGYRVVSDHGPCHQICWTANNKFTRTPEAKANAKLIASAPELLAKMARYLPVLEKLEQDPVQWLYFTAGTGIATLNGYKAALSKAAGTNLES